MLVRLDGRLMLVSEVVPENASAPMLVTPDGIVMLVSEVAPSNARAPMLVTPTGITTAPAHEPPEYTTPLKILKFGVEVDLTPVVQWYVPSIAAMPLVITTGALASPNDIPTATKIPIP
jgi:hypothetical protein